ncbi:MAG: HAMP domain-containing sensor histidine kinase [Bacteroidales bacterium]|nr:HAMP domain-containing sensor histidine kinase [Bacteroidales bacterium]MDD4669597.1 HAMP domain-containing sensor histidine kinase [Bacteroidales bacterium]
MDFKYKTPFHRRLFISIFVISILFLISFLWFQYQREKEYKIEELNYKLQLFNTFFERIDIDSTAIQNIMESNKPAGFDNLRLSIIDSSGVVLFDSEAKSHLSNLNNHHNRHEVTEALRNGSGYTIRRLSESTNEEYFYSATKSGNIIIRSAVPYSLPLREVLRADRKFIWFTLVIATIICILSFVLTRRLGNNISRLKQFALQADKGEIIDNIDDFSNDELGDISKQIVKIYAQVKQTKEALEHEHSVVVYQEQEQVRLKKQLTQNINHELKTPVSSILGYLETIINNPDMSDDKRNDFIVKSYAQVTRLSHLLIDISTITRMDEASNMIEKEEICLSDIVNEVFADAKEKIESKGINVIISMPQPSYIIGNQSLLLSVFNNLLENALSYSECTTIELTITEDKQDNYSVIFADNGVGVPQEHLPRLFERFYRIDKGRSRKAGGTGLGLSIVKNAVILHGGAIMAKDHNGVGIEFVFSLKHKS